MSTPEAAALRPKILIVDDTLQNLQLLTDMLAQSGYSVTGAPDGPTALMIARNNPPDLVLLDIMMPEMDGYEVCGLLKTGRETSHIPVIFLSALEDTADKIKGFQAGGVDFITKPFQSQEVTARIETHLKLRNFQKRLEEQNTLLQTEIVARRNAEEALKTHSDQLETLVAERTNKLVKLNEQLRLSVGEKETLLRELYHRTKNNMQVISAMLNLQFGNFNDERVTRIVEETERKIQSMALVHQHLYQSKNLSNISLRKYISELTEFLSKSYGVRTNNISFSLDVDDITTLIDIAIPCGLILNELISNSLKHAFPDDTAGEIRIRLEKTEEGEILLGFSDNGVGFPAEFDFLKTNTMGIQTILGVGKHQLRGNVSFISNDGVSCHIRFKPENLYTERV